MSSQSGTAAEQHATRMSQLLDEKDARVQHHRQRPLPAVLAGRRNRRALALLPALPLAGGLYAGTLPDNLLRSTLMTVVAALSVAGLLLLRRVTRLLDAVPDRLLDEREVSERNVAHRRAHGLVLALMTVMALMAIADGTVRKVTGSTLVGSDGWISITLTAMLVSAMIPAAVLAWRHNESPDHADD